VWSVQAEAGEDRRSEKVRSVPLTIDTDPSSAISSGRSTQTISQPHRHEGRYDADFPVRSGPRYVNAAFTAHEVEVITTAHPTPAEHDLTRTWSPQQPRRS
jgi:hypothetical protein